MVRRVYGQGNFNFVYRSPESLAGDSSFGDMFSWICFPGGIQ